MYEYNLIGHNDDSNISWFFKFFNNGLEFKESVQDS